MIAWLALPLEVLPGWPQPEHVSTLHLLLLTVGAPLALLLVIAAIGWTPRLMRRGREEARAEGLALDSYEAEPAPAALEGANSSARRALDA